MKKFIYVIIIAFYFSAIYGQIAISGIHERVEVTLMDEILLSNDTTFDVKFYHLDLEIGIKNKYVKGSVGYVLTSKIDKLNSVILDLDDSFEIDSVSFPAINYEFENNILRIFFLNDFSIGDNISFRVYYHGEPKLEGDIKGLVYKTHNGDEPVIVSLSTPYLAHKWWPCKDGVFDKSDSTYIDITIKDTIVNSIPLIAVSNGLLDTVEVNGEMKTFKWRHMYPIVPYYVMVAISNYKYFNQTYSRDGYTFPIDYYVFDSHLEEAKSGVSDLPKVMDLFTDLFGPYPFLKEKYGMTQIGHYSAIENQTNTITRNMGKPWFYVSVHELAHMWFADMITCESWNHGWLNEGFASYAEALYAEKIGGDMAYDSYVYGDRYYGAGSIYMENVSNPFNVFRGIIYKKGSYILHMLRYVMGDEYFFKAIKEYATDERFLYKSSTTEDFQKVCEKIMGESLEYFFDQWIYDEYYPEYNYNFNQDRIEGRVEVIISQIQESIGRRPVFIMPIEIKFKFADGLDTTFVVFNELKYQSFSFDLTKDILDVEIDPNNRILKDVAFDDTLGFNDVQKRDSDLILFPNPNNGLFSLHINPELVGMSANITIVNLNSEMVFQSMKKDLGQDEMLGIPNTINPGVYILKLVVGNNQFIKKLIVTK